MESFEMLYRIDLDNRTTCSKGVVLTINLPKDCRLNETILKEYVEKIFVAGLLKELCAGCPLEKPH